MGKKILLADDSITIQKVIELTFSDEDFDVVTVGNGRLALERLPEVRPDIVLCDIIMPEKDGYEVCEAIKTSAAWSQVPVLLLTGAFEPFDQERAARAGYDGSLAKPFEPETLIAKVKELLARAPTRAAAPPPPARPSVMAPPPLAPATPPRAAAAPPLPTPVVPFPRPAIAPPAPPPTPAPAIPFAPPASIRPPGATPPRFIPDEPFGTLDVSAFTAEGPAAKVPAAEPLVPLTSAESAALSPPVAPEQPGADTATTVMFRSTDLPWATPPGAATTPPPVGGIPEAGRTIVPEPAFVPEGPESAEKEVEASVFEEVLEEDLEFGPAGFAPKPTAGPSTVATVEAAPLAPETPTIPPIGPPSDEATTGAFTAVELEREPTPFATAREEAAFGSTQQRPPALSAETGKAEAFGLGREEITFEPELVVAPEPPRAPAGPPSAPAPPSAPESFADVAPEAGEPNAPPPTASEAAAVAVPVDMVEKIAQRVVAQISERVVREIAWDVIPDLAEALIKQEIERLKAELQKT